MNASEARKLTEENGPALNPLYLKAALDTIAFSAKLGDSYILYPMSDARKRALLAQELVALGYEVLGGEDSVLTVRW